MFSQVRVILSMGVYPSMHLSRGVDRESVDMMGVATEAGGMHSCSVEICSAFTQVFFHTILLLYYVAILTKNVAILT